MLMSKLPLIVIIAHKSCHIYALHPPSVCLVPTINLNTENHTTFKLRGQVTDDRSNWRSDSEGRLHIVSACAAFSSVKCG